MCEANREYVKKQTNVDGDDGDETQLVAFMGFDTIEELGVLNGSPENLRYVLFVAHGANRLKGTGKSK